MTSWVGTIGGRSENSEAGSRSSNLPWRNNGGDKASMFSGSVFGGPNGPMSILPTVSKNVSAVLPIVQKPSGGMFGNINALRDGAGQDEIKKVDLYKESGCMATLARSKPFEYLTLTIIFLNAIWIGIDTDLNPGETMATSPLVFQVFENIFCFYFTGEVVVRFCAFKKKCDMRKDYWFLFDSFLVSFMVFETWIMWAVGGNGPFQGLSILRLLRLARLTRMARLMRSIPELLTMIKGLVAALRSVSSVLLFLAIIIYVYAIVFTGNYQKVDTIVMGETTEALEPLFGNLGQAMLTLLLCGTLLDDLSPVVTMIREDSVIMLLLFFSFIVLSSFTVLNMLIGILCEVVSATEAGEKHKMKVNAVREVLTREFKKIDKDGTDTISQIEFDTMLDDQSGNGVMDVLAKELDIHKNHLAEMKPLLFGDLSDEGGEKRAELSFNDFLNLLIRLRPGESASPIDIQEFRKLLREQERLFTGRVGKLQHQVDALRPKVRAAAAAQAQLAAPQPPPLTSHATEPPSQTSSAKRVFSQSFPASSPAKAASTQPGATGQTQATGAPLGSKAHSPDTITSLLGEVHQEFSELDPTVRSLTGEVSPWEEDLKNALDCEIVEELRRRMPGWK